MFEETKEHLALKKKGRAILRKAGFKESEIYEEYDWKKFIIDVAGINENKKFFIECGTIEKDKYNQLANNKKISFLHLKYSTKDNKLIKNIDHSTWREFSGHCRANGVLMGHALNDILKDFLKKEKIKR